VGVRDFKKRSLKQILDMEHYKMGLTLKIWRQKNSQSKGHFETYKIGDISSEMSFLEMIDVLNERLISEGQDPVAFDHDCREGICGTCSMYINGRPHGPWHANTTCQLHMRAYKDGDTITIEPWRANSFPVIKDLIVDRSAFDRIIQAGGFISVNTFCIGKGFSSGPFTARTTRTEIPRFKYGCTNGQRRIWQLY
jgi:succinate dehydrogenase / fumarate reductase iron-sulfur subunit